MMNYSPSLHYTRTSGQQSSTDAHSCVYLRLASTLRPAELTRITSRAALPASVGALCVPQSFQKVVIVCVRSDPEPRDLVAVDEIHRPVVHVNPCREDRPSRMDTLEVKARVVRVLREEGIGFLRLPPDILG